MEKLKVSSSLYQLLNVIRNKKYPLYTMIEASEALKKLTVGFSPTEEELLIKYLAFSKDVELEEKPCKFNLEVGSVVTLPDGKEVVVSEDVVIYGKEYWE